MTRWKTESESGVGILDRINRIYRIMKMTKAGMTWAVGLLVWIVVCAGMPAAEWVSERAEAGSFALASEGRVAAVVVAEGEFEAVALAASDLAVDVERVSGVKPEVKTVSDTTIGDRVLRHEYHSAVRLSQRPA